MARTGQRDPEATRAAILEAAEAAFVEGGYADASMSDVARRARVTKSLIHHHFGSKQELWDAVKAHRFTEYASQQAGLLEGTRVDADTLRTSIEAYFRFLQRHPGFVRLLSWMNLERDDHSFETGDALVSLGAARIRAAQEVGELRADIDPTHAIFAFLALCQGWFQMRHHGAPCWCGGPEAEAARAATGGLDAAAADDSFLDTILKLFFEGILPRPAAEGRDRDPSGS